MGAELDAFIGWRDLRGRAGRAGAPAYAKAVSLSTAVSALANAILTMKSFDHHLTII